MEDQSKTKQELIQELVSLRQRIAELEQSESEHQRAQQAIRTNKAQLSNALEMAHLGYWEYDVADDLFTFNDQFYKVFHTTVEQVGGYTMRSAEYARRFVHPDDKDVVREEIQKSIESIEPNLTQQIEHRILFADGTVGYITVRILVVKDSQARTVKTYGVNQDITKSKRIEVELRDSEERYRIIVEASSDAVLLRSKDNIVIYANPAALKLFRANHPGDLIGKRYFDLVHPDDRALSVERAKKTLDEKWTASPREHRMLALDGQIVHVESTGIFVQYRGEAHIYGIFRDITERKQAEMELLREKLFTEKLLESLPGIFFLYDSTCHLKRWNKEHETATGFSADELRDWYIPDWHETPEDAAMGMALVKSVLETGVGGAFETTLINKEGRFVPYLISITRLLMPEGPAMMGVGIDITERKQAEIEKAKLEGHLQQAQKMESVGRLAGGVAHDFNNMLGVILGHAEMAMEQVDPAHPLHADLEEIRNAANRSADLTRQLLAFARKQVVSPKVIDLNETVEGMLKMLRRLLGEDINLSWHPGAGLWPVRVDPSQIDQILANLCVNARDAISGIGKMIIETENCAIDEQYCADHAGFVPGDYLLLTVSDDGCGMDKETIDKIFEPFFTTKGEGKGTGLGLATVYGIVKQNNGFVNVYSEQGQGTTFKIYLPRHKGNAEQAETEPSVEPLRRGQATILLVEDEPALLELSKLMLEMQGYQVLPAGTPGEALRLAGEYAGEIHLLMTDVVMPEMNGRDLADKMLSLYPNLKCLFTSGYTANVIAHQGVLDENVHFIQKPFSRRDLAAKVGEVLDQK
jgi:two-component system cell cycle sensor histidine kinase/response regulator CckA